MGVFPFQGKTHMVEPGIEPLKAQAVLSPVPIAKYTGWAPQNLPAPKGPEAALSPVPIAEYVGWAPQKLLAPRREPNYDSSLYPARSLITILSRPRFQLI